MPKLIEQGHVYAVLPPLFRVVVNGKSHYFNTQEEVEKFTKTVKKGSYSITRFKGLVA